MANVHLWVIQLNMYRSASIYEAVPGAFPPAPTKDIRMFWVTPLVRIESH